MAVDWSISKSLDACCVCQQPFSEGALTRAWLFAAGESFERRDCCPGCEPTDAASAVGVWLARRHPPQTRAAPVVDRAALLRVFSELPPGEGEAQHRFRFALALLLWRRKALKLVGSCDGEGGELWQFTAPATNERFDVLRPELDEQAISDLGTRLEELIAGLSLHPGEEPASAPPEPAAAVA